MSDGEEFKVYKHVSLVKDDGALTFANLISQFLFNKRGIRQNNLLSFNISKHQDISKYIIHEGFLFLSLLMQLFFKYMSRPLDILKSMVDYFLNNNLQPESVGFYSFIGQFDKRLDLDNNIKQGGGKYYAALSMMASKLAYENEAVIQNAVSQHWKMEFVKFYNFYNEFQQKWRTQAFMFRDKSSNNNEMIYVCFRGTSFFNADDWSTDFDFSWCKIKGLGKTHTGFNLALGLKKYCPDNTSECDQLHDFYGYWPKEIEHDDDEQQHALAYYTLRQKLREMLAQNPNAKFIVTGHSLGGALAILFPAILVLHQEWELLDRMAGVYTYGQPRVGDEKFAQIIKTKFNEHQIKYYRMVYANDMVPTVPWDFMMLFKHFGTCIHFNSLYEAKIVGEEVEQRPTKILKEGNLIKWLYLLIKWIIMFIISSLTSRLNAVWELLRTFIIQYVVGSDYKEEWINVLCRMCGVLLPGGAEHFPRDYVNSTRLASLDIFDEEE